MPINEKTWPASKIEMWVIDKIKPYQSNPRTHPPAQIALLAQAMVEEGVTSPILVDEDGVIIAGHGRRLAALQNGFRKYPVVVARGWSETRKRAARLKDNSLGLLSGWDQGLLKLELQELKFENYDLPLLGFGDLQLVEFMTGPQPPAEFGVHDERTMPTEFCCPRCSYRWSGDPMAGAKKEMEPEKPMPAKKKGSK